jgi:cell division protease FtsH
VHLTYWSHDFGVMEWGRSTGVRSSLHQTAHRDEMADELRRRYARSPLGRHPRLLPSLLICLALTLLGGVALLSRTGSVGPVVAGPTFTYPNGWTLLELQRHIEAGEVVAVTSAPASQAGPATLVAKTTTGQLVPVNLTAPSGQAASALAALGYGSLLTSEAWQSVGSTAPRSDSDLTRTVGSLLVSAILIAVLLAVWSRFGGGRSRRDTATKFTTILPATAAPASGQAARQNEMRAAGIVATVPIVRLDDVAGCDEAKLEITEAIDFLKEPDRFQQLGARIPRGVLLYGPPGTGKTMLARAVAAEAGVAFLSASGSEFVEKYVGVGARRMRDLFRQARKLGRAVVFIDEFDAIGKSRGGPNSHEEREQTLNQLLVEMDGFDSSEEIVIIAATNRLDVLDEALLRPGRFTRKIHVGLPDVAGRRAILEVHARNKPLAADADLDAIARKTYGFSGAQLADLLNESAILAARHGRDTIGLVDLHAGWLKVAVGTSRRRSMDERERSIIAAHEVGHAICGRVHGDKRKVEEISLFAHGEALGVTVSSQEDNDLPSESDLRARLVALMGGRAAEELLFQEVTGGASNDFEKANQIASLMVTRWGMGRDPDASERGVSGRGTLSFLVASRSGALPSDVQSAATRAIRAILDEAYEQATQTLIAEMATLRRIAAYLFEHERIDGETFEALCAGDIEVPASLDEWRAAASRPRDWTEIPEYATDRRRAARPESTPPGATLPVAATSRVGADTLNTPRPRRPLVRPARARLVMPIVRRRLQGVAVAALKQAQRLEGERGEPSTDA